MTLDEDHCMELLHTTGRVYCRQHRRRLCQAQQGRQSALPDIAEGSLEESRYYLILSEDLGYGKTQELLQSLEEVSHLLNRYVRAIVASGS